MIDSESRPFLSGTNETARVGWQEIAASGATVWVVGKAFHQGRLLDTSSLGRLIAERRTNDIEQFSSFLRELNGYWSAVVYDDEGVWAGVDQVRSIELFYRLRDSRIEISPDFRAICGSGAELRLDPEAMVEYLAMMYVLGEKTLSPDVFQMQAGQCLFWSAENGLRASRYYSYPYTARELNGGRDDSRSEQECSEQMAASLRAAFMRTIEAAAGRRIVFPLSGGWDSRALAALAAENGVNAIAFSYGLRGNEEAEISRDVAKSLGIPWHFAAYDSDSVSTEDQHLATAQYISECCNGGHVAHVQDFWATRELVRQGVLQPDDVLVPGHTGDVLSGSQLPRSLWTDDEVPNPRGTLIAGIGERHIDVWPSLTRHAGVYARLEEQLAARSIESNADSVAAHNYWGWQERQSKYIVHSVRAYDFHRLGWWLPFWDRGLMDFFACLPDRFLFGRRLYFKTLTERIFSPELKDIPIANFGYAPRDWAVFTEKLRLRGRPTTPIVRLKKFVWKRPALNRFANILRRPFVRSSPKVHPIGLQAVLLSRWFEPGMKTWKDLRLKMTSLPDGKTAQLLANNDLLALSSCPFNGVIAAKYLFELEESLQS